MRRAQPEEEAPREESWPVRAAIIEALGLCLLPISIAMGDAKAVPPMNGLATMLADGLEDDVLPKETTREQLKHVRRTFFGDTSPGEK